MSILRTYKNLRYLSNTVKTFSNQSNETRFEHVFSFPFAKYFALFNRLKVYHFYGACITLPTCGIMELSNVFPANTFLSASYIGVTGGIVLSLFSFPFRNIIGHIYISDDNKMIKISSVNFLGKRKDETIPTGDWIPLLNMKPKTLDAIYLTPMLTNGTKYKMFYKFGIVKNQKKMGQVLE